MNEIKASPAFVFYNTLGRAKQAFEPIDAANVRLYVCGPTVYDAAHIGNARPVVVFDLLFRLLRQRYGAQHVTYIRNITDVDDKINARAQARGVGIEELTRQTTAMFHQDMAALHVLRPSAEPRATEYIAEMIEAIKVLIEKGHAYTAQKHVLFHVPSMPEYGRLSNRSVDDMIAGARVDVAPYKKNPMDFVLWKPSRQEEPAWESPWCRGRPGWHIECSAMSAKHLGVPFDIHGGGADLIFPHHENERAQSCCVGDCGEMAHFWMHNGYVQVEGEKMSKSTGNFITVRDLLATTPGTVIRLALLMSHYRQPLNWTHKRKLEAKKMLDSWSNTLEGTGQKAPGAACFSPKPCAQLLAFLGDDLNTPAAIGFLHSQARDAASSKKIWQRFGNNLCFLGLTAHLDERKSWQTASRQTLDTQAIKDKITQRTRARKQKDFALADQIRDELAAQGVALVDTPQGTTWRLEK